MCMIEVISLLSLVVIATIFYIAFYDEVYIKHKFIKYKKNEHKILEEFQKYGYTEIKFVYQDLKHYFISPSKKWLIFSTDEENPYLKLWSIRSANYEKIPFKYERFFWEVEDAVKEISKIEMKMKIYNVNKKKQDILKDFQM